MSRKRPRKRLRDRRSILLIGEGGTEAAFLHYLKSHPSLRGIVQVTVRAAKGGSPDYMIRHTRNVMAYMSAGDSFKHVFLLIDGDCISSAQDEERLCRAARGLTLLVSRPCVEALFLAFLEPERDWSREEAGTIKRYFHRSYLGEREKMEPEAYTRLDALRLDALISTCRAREHGHGAWAYDIVSRLLGAMFGEDSIGNSHDG